MLAEISRADIELSTEHKGTIRPPPHAIFRKSAPRRPSRMCRHRPTSGSQHPSRMSLRIAPQDGRPMPLACQSNALPFRNSCPKRTFVRTSGRFSAHPLCFHRKASMYEIFPKSALTPEPMAFTPRTLRMAWCGLREPFAGKCGLREHSAR